MSAKNRGSTTIEHEHYTTPEGAIISLCNELGMDEYQRENAIFGEPCLAEGQIMRVMTEKLQLTQPWEWAEIRQGRDYLTDGLTGEADAEVTNPPFSMATDFLDKSFAGGAPFVAYLLRLNFFGSGKRHDWWQGKEPTHLFTLSERPSFVDVCKGRKSAGIKPCKAAYRKEDHVKVCACGGTVGAGTDATEYAWFVWDHAGLCKRKPGMYVI